MSGLDRLTTFSQFRSISEQAYRITAVGRFSQHLSGLGLNADHDLLGLKGTLAHSPSGLKVGLAVNRYGGDERTVTTFGNWGGYPEFVGMPYLYAEGNSVSAIARSRLVKLTVQIDFGKYGLPGHSLLLGHSRIDLDQAILPGSNIGLGNLVYRANLSDTLSARLSLESRHSSNARYDNDFLTLSMRYDY